MSQHELDALAESIQQAWEAKRICSLVGRGCRARIIRIARLLAAGRIDCDRAMRLAREAEAAAFCFSPLPPEGQP